MWRKCVLQTDHCINSSVLCLHMPFVVCSLEVFERILLIWLDATELFMGEKLPFSFAVVLTGFRTFNQQPDITQNRVLWNIIQQQLIYKGLSTDCVLCENKCFGICVTPFKTTDSSAPFMFITFIHSCSRGSKWCLKSHLLVEKVTVKIHLHTRASAVKDSSVPIDGSCRGQRSIDVSIEGKIVFPLDPWNTLRNCCFQNRQICSRESNVDRTHFWFSHLNYLRLYLDTLQWIVDVISLKLV